MPPAESSAPPFDLPALRAELRRGFDLPPGEVLLNVAGGGPMCQVAAQAIARTAQRLCQGPFAVDELFADYERARATFARLLGAAPGDVAFFHTCAAAISQVALGLHFRPGDEIVTWANEYPSNAYPWHVAAQRSGATVRIVPGEPDRSLRQERLHAAIGPRTRVVAVSWVQFQAGAVTDLPSLSRACRQVGAWLVVDAIQGLGVMPLDMQALGIDAVCGGTNKWLCGPLGHGFLALAPGRTTELTPLLHGAMTYGMPGDEVDPHKPPRPDAHRFEPGSPLLLSGLGGAAAIEWLLGFGIAELHRAALALADELCDGLRARGLQILGQRSDAESPLRSPIVTFLPRPGHSASALAEKLLRRKVACSLRAGGIRVSPHAYNDESDLAALFAALDAAE